MSSPSGALSLNFASVHARSTSSDQISFRVRKLFNSTPHLSLGRLASVVPASPTNKSSESSSRYHKAREAFQLSSQTPLNPNSAPFDSTNGSAEDTASPLTGSILAVT